MKLKFSLVFILFAVLMAAVIILNYNLQIHQASTVMASFGGMPVLERVSARIDGDKYERLTQTLDESDPFYIEMREAFREIKKDSQCLYLYTLTRYDDGVHRFILDAEETDSEDFSPLGAEEDVSIYESAYFKTYDTQAPQVAWLENISVWGLMTSAYMPIFNSNGDMVGVIGVDYDAEDIYNTIMSSLWMQILLFVIFIAVGLLIYFFFLKNLSNQNEILKKLNRVKTEFLQDMSHEMKNPLTLIATGIDFSNRQIEKKDGDLMEVGKALDRIQEETQRLGRMVGGMVTLASLSETVENRKRVNFAALLRDSAEAARITLEQNNNAVSVEIAHGMPDVFVERDRFTQVMVNLLSNAAEYTRDGKISVMADFDSALITVRIADTGVGVPPDILPRVFERGVSGNNGTGYGLYICKIIVEAHGGTINIASEPVNGTVVTFTVPVYGGQQMGRER